MREVRGGGGWGGGGQFDSLVFQHVSCFSPVIALGVLKAAGCAPGVSPPGSHNS